MNASTSFAASSFTTRAALIEALAGKAVAGAAAEAIAKETAFGRHNHRIGLAVEAARTGAVSFGGEETIERDIMAIGLIVLDAFGVGGHGGVSGTSSRRLPVFSQLGKGRKRACDGAAWTAALTAARDVLTRAQFGERPTKVWFTSCGVDGLALEVSTTDVPSDHETLVPWVLTVAREGLRTAVGLAPWFNVEGVEFEQDAEMWGRLVNEAERIQQAIVVSQAETAAEAEGRCLASNAWNPGESGACPVTIEQASATISATVALKYPRVSLSQLAHAALGAAQVRWEDLTTQTSNS